MSTETILDEAKRIVDGERQKDYGPASQNHGLTAAFWSAYLGVEITARDVCLLNILQKVSREGSGAPKRDNLVDIAGFARNAELVSQVPRTIEGLDEVSGVPPKILAEYVAGVDPAAPGEDRTVVAALAAGPATEFAWLAETVSPAGLYGMTCLSDGQVRLTATATQAQRFSTKAECSKWIEELPTEKLKVFGALVPREHGFWSRPAATVTGRVDAVVTVPMADDVARSIRESISRHGLRTTREAPRGHTVEELDAHIQVEGGHNVTGDSPKDLPGVPRAVVEELTRPLLPGADAAPKFPIRFAGEARWSKSLREMPPSESSAGCLAMTSSGALCAVLAGVDESGVVSVRVWKGLNTRIAGQHLRWASPSGVQRFLDGQRIVEAGGVRP